MSGRTGLGVVEIAVLDALDAVGASPGSTRVKTARVLTQLETTAGIAPRYGYEVLLDLARPWTVPLRLVDFHGNYGDVGFPPASPKYTEARLAPAGVLALAAERDEKPPVPIGLINGTTYAGGTRPPFAPSAIVGALLRLLDNPTATDAEVLAVAGGPSFPMACRVGGQVREVLEGAPATLHLSAVIERDAKPGSVVLTNLPPGVSSGDVFENIAARVNTYYDERERSPELAERTRLDLTAVEDRSTGEDTRIICTAKAGTDLDALVERLYEIWGVSIDLPVNLGQPLPELLRNWVNEHADLGIRASLEGLRSVL